MATVQKSISKSSSYTTRTLTTTISAPGIRQNAEISVSPSIDASKVSYVINEAAGTITVTLTNAGYTRYTRYSSGESWMCYYVGADTGKTWAYQRNSPCEVVSSYGEEFGTLTSEHYNPPSTYYTHYFEYTITVNYKTFPEFAVRQNGQLKSSTDGWVRVNGQLRQIQQMWARVNGNLKEV